MGVVTKHIDQGIGYIAMNRPEKRNALSVGMANELVRTLREMDASIDVQLVILYGNGKDYSAGGDIETIRSFENPDDVMTYMKQVSEVTRTIRQMNKFVISAVHGNAAGGGVSLAFASDFLVMDKGARLIAGFTQIGLIPDLGLIKRLTTFVPDAIAKEWLTTNRALSAEEAKQLRLTNRIATGDVIKEAEALAKEVTVGAPLANRYVKQLVNQAPELSDENFLSQEQLVQAMLAQTVDHKEGVKGFLEKRAPHFKGNW